MHILPCVFSTFNWLILTSEKQFLRFHQYATLRMSLRWKYIRNYLLVYHYMYYHWTSHFLSYLETTRSLKTVIILIYRPILVTAYRPGLCIHSCMQDLSGFHRWDYNLLGHGSSRTNHVRQTTNKQTNFRFAIRKIWAFIWNQKNTLLPVEQLGMRMWSA